MDNPRIIIIGAGPAGIRCAETLVQVGIKPIIIDEQPFSGGQIYRQQPNNFKRSYEELYGTESKKAKSVHDAFARISGDVNYFPKTTAWAVQDKTLYAHQDNNPIELEFDFIILCTGATDRVLPIKGWDLAGTYSLGGAQIALKHQASSIGSNVCFVGTGPLLYLVAYQYLKAGANVKGVFDTSTYRDRVLALPHLMMKPKALIQGFKMINALKKANIMIKTGITPRKITGEDSVSGLEISDHKGDTFSIDCDAIGIGFHIKPESQIADLLGCDFRYDELTQQWIPSVNHLGQTSNKHVYSAGDGCRTLGADAAEVSGKIAALSLLDTLSMLSPKQQKYQKRLLHKFKRLCRFGNGLAKAFPWPSHLIDSMLDDTIVCRCEMVTKAEIKLSVNTKEADEVNRAKSFSRTGMGRCQGRYCSHVNAHIIAKEKQQSVEKSGRQRSQAPVKPIPVNVYVQSEPEDVSL